MARVQWPLLGERPGVQVVLSLAQGGQPLPRNLLADTGAGSRRTTVDLLLSEADCRLCGGTPDKPIVLGRAYTGSFPTYYLRVQLPALGFDQDLRVVAVQHVPAGFDGVACFRFLSRFAYGNFGDSDQFGLEV